jgi:hypothetical protein
MNRRILSLLAVAGTLAYACGPRSRTSDLAVVSLAGTPTKHATPPKPAAARRVERTERTQSIDARLDVQVAPEAVHFAFNLKNVGAKHVELIFRNGQSYDFVVVDSIGREVWRWAAGRLFTQTVRNKSLGKGETMRVGEALAQAIPPGRYTAIATLKSSNYPLEQRADFVVGPVNVATTK